MEPTSLLRRRPTALSNSTDVAAERYLRELEENELRGTPTFSPNDLLFNSPPPLLLVPSPAPAWSSAPVKRPVYMANAARDLKRDQAPPLSRPVRYREQCDIVDQGHQRVPASSSSPSRSTWSVSDSPPPPPRTPTPHYSTLKRRLCFPYTYLPPTKSLRTTTRPSPSAAAATAEPIDWTNQERMMIEAEFDGAMSAAEHFLLQLATADAPLYLPERARRLKYALVALLNQLVAELPSIFASTGHKVVAAFIKETLRFVVSANVLEKPVAADGTMRTVESQAEASIAAPYRQQIDAVTLPGQALTLLVNWVREFDTRFAKEISRMRGPVY